MTLDFRVFTQTSTIETTNSQHFGSNSKFGKITDDLQLLQGNSKDEDRDHANLIPRAFRLLGGMLARWPRYSIFRSIG